MKNYEINENTMAVVPISYYKTKIIELDRELLILENAYKIMDYNCRYYGSTYKGRYKAGKDMLKSSYKIPIIVEESNGLIFFPTKSSLEDDCSWINYSYIKDIQKGEKTTKIVFNNGLVLESTRSKLSLDNQLARSMQLDSILRRRAKSLLSEKS